MNYFNTEEVKNEEGVFVKYHDGYFTFQLSFDELIVFEEVSTEVLQEYNLKSNDFIGIPFKITYKEIISDLDDEDFIIFRLLKLSPIK